MKDNLVNKTFAALFFLALMFVSACSSVSKAPVESRDWRRQSASRASTPPSESEPASGTAKALADRHVVGRGETLYSIAWRYGHDYRSLAVWNGIPSPYVIHPGQKLDLKPNKPSAASLAAAAPTTSPSNTPPTVQPTPSSRRPDFVPLSEPTPRTEPEKQRPVKAPQERTTAMTAPPRPKPQPQHQSTKPLPKPKSAQVNDSRKFPPQQAAAQPSKPVKTAKPIAKGPVKWQWPVAGEYSKSKSRSGDIGLEIVGKTGQVVMAAAPGEIVYRGDGLRRYGQLIIVKHNDDYLSAYAHNNKILIEEGQKVSGGQPIAEMGTTGSSKARLYFEIRRAGKPVDPLKYLPKLTL